MSGRWLPPDHALGDANTIGGYMRVHARPAAFEGSDGRSYSVALESEATGDADRPHAAWLLFLRWGRIGEQRVDAHVESDYLEWGASREAALEALGAWPLERVRQVLEARIAAQATGRPARRWWDVMRDDA